MGGATLFLLYAGPLVFFARALRREACRPYALAGILLVSSYIGFGLSQVLFSHHVGTGFYALGIAVLAGLCLASGPAGGAPPVEPS